MRYLGNVLFDGDGYMPPISPFLKLFTSIEEIKNRLPTLIVGMDSAKKYIEDFSILKKAYPKQNKWWTFARTERGVDYIDDMEAFIEMLVNRIIGDIDYKYINIITAKYSEIKSFLELLSSDKDKYCYNDRNRFLFIYDKKGAIIYGISLSTCEYVGIDKNKVIERILRGSYVVPIRRFTNIPTEIRNKYSLLHQLVGLWPEFEKDEKDAINPTEYKEYSVDYGE